MKVEKLQKLIEVPGVFKPRRTSTPIRELDVVKDPDPSIEVIEDVFSKYSSITWYLLNCIKYFDHVADKRFGCAYKKVFTITVFSFNSHD